MFFPVSAEDVEALLSALDVRQVHWSRESFDPPARRPPGLQRLADPRAAAPDDAGVAAREALSVLPRSRTDEALMDRLSRGDAASKRLAVEILTARAYRPIIEKLYDAKMFEEQEPAKAVVVAIEKLGTKEEFPRALAFAVQLPADRREVLVSRLYVLAKRMSDSKRVLAAVQKAIASAGKDGQGDLVGLLALAQEPESLKSLEEYLRDINVELRKEAVRTLSPSRATLRPLPVPRPAWLPVDRRHDRRRWRAL